MCGFHREALERAHIQVFVCDASDASSVQVIYNVLLECVYNQFSIVCVMYSCNVAY